MREPDHHQNYSVRLLRSIAISLVLIVVILVFTNLSAFSGLVKLLLRVMSSIFYGFLFAYLLNPLVNMVDKRLGPFLCRHWKRQTAARRLSRVVGMFFAYAVASFLIYLMVHTVVPRVGQSISEIVSSFPGYYRSAEAWVLDLLEDPEIRRVADMVLERAYTFLDDFINTDLLGTAQELIVSLTSSVYAFVREIINMVIGIVVSLYVLLSKDKFLAQSKKLLVALCEPETADRYMEHGRKINRIFNGFIIGKIIDSIIIGILCYIGVSILKMPYPELLAIIVGVTNVIPYFGPIIGAVPCALLVLLVDPLKCLYFIIFAVVLQQIDGNIIGPRILGENVGISGFWILVSITVGGGLFGFIGMLLGVPVFAAIYMLIGDAVNRALSRQGHPIRTDDYRSIRHVADLAPKAPGQPGEGDVPSAAAGDAAAKDPPAPAGKG